MLFVDARECTLDAEGGLAKLHILEFGLLNKFVNFGEFFSLAELEGNGGQFVGEELN